MRMLQASTHLLLKAMQSRISTSSGSAWKGDRNVQKLAREATYCLTKLVMQCFSREEAKFLFTKQGVDPQWHDKIIEIFGTTPMILREFIVVLPYMSVRVVCSLSWMISLKI